MEFNLNRVVLFKGARVFLLLFFIGPIASYSQSSAVFSTLEGPLQNDVLRGLEADFLKSRSSRSDSIGLIKALRSTLDEAREAGYLEARIDSVSGSVQSPVVWWHLGVRSTWKGIRTNPSDQYWLSAAGVRRRLIEKNAFSSRNYSTLSQKALRWMAENGYPFASIRIDSVESHASGVEARLSIDEGPLVLFDSLLLKGDARVKSAYLINYLKIRPGSPYNESEVSRVASRLKEIPFLSEARTMEVEYYGEKARPVLFLKDRKASQFNGVVGVQPDNSGSGKVHIAGDVRLRLHNAFGRAELVDLNWSNPLPLSQDLKLKASFPFLFSLPVGIEGDLSLFKKDSTFLELDRQVAFRYFLGGMNSIRLMLGRKTSNLISTARYRNATVLPPFADVSANNYGLGLMLMDLDYRLNPRRGYAVDVAGSAGIRIIDRNVALPEALYDSIDLRTTQYRLHCIADAYLPLGGRGVFNPGVSGAWMQADNIFSNELYRFGGLKSLRGFDEQSLGASAYLIGKAEFRFILEQNSYLLAFYNRAWYQDKSRVPEFEDSPYGFGVGITFDSKLGIFSFTYALGSQQGNPVEFRSAKVHFGVINYF